MYVHSDRACTRMLTAAALLIVETKQKTKTKKTHLNLALPTE